MRLYFFLLLAFHSLFAQAQTTTPVPITQAPTTPTGTTTNVSPDSVKTIAVRVAVVTDTMGEYQIVVGRKIGQGLRLRRATLLRRIEVLNTGQAREIERYMVDDRNRRIRARIWNAAEIPKG